MGPINWNWRKIRIDPECWDPTTIIWSSRYNWEFKKPPYLPKLSPFDRHLKSLERYYALSWIEDLWIFKQLMWVWTMSLKWKTTNLGAVALNWHKRGIYTLKIIAHISSNEFECLLLKLLFRWFLVWVSNRLVKLYMILFSVIYFSFWRKHCVKV